MQRRNGHVMTAATDGSRDTEPCAHCGNEPDECLCAMSELVRADELDRLLDLEDPDLWADDDEVDHDDDDEC